MRWLFALTISGLMAGGLASAVHAANPNQVRQFLRTNACEGCDLSDADFSGLDFTGANLSGANLSGARFVRSNLTRADLSGADLSQVILTGANLRGANLTGADLTDAYSLDICSTPGFSQAQANDPTSCITFTLLSVLGTDLCDPAYALEDLLGAEQFAAFCESEAEQYEFQRALLDQFGFFEPLNLQAADLTGANLTNASFPGIDLRYATLTDARLEQADLTNAFLIEAEVADTQREGLQTALVTKADVRSRMQGILQQQQEAARQVEGKQYLGSINRAQQAYFLENNEFADNLDALMLGIPSETENYQFSVVPQSDMTRSVVAIAQAKAEGLNSYTSAVFLVDIPSPDGSDTTNQTTVAILCETEEPSMTPPAAPELDATVGSTDFLTCPAGSRQVQ